MIDAGADPADLRAAGFRLLSIDWLSGRQTWIRFEAGDEERTRFTVREIAPVDAIVAANHEQRADAAGSRHGDIAPIARVPMHIFQAKLAEPMRQGDRKHLDRVLNESAFDPWRLRDGRI